MIINTVCGVSSKDIYDDLTGRSASGTFPRFDGVFPGTEMEHTVLYGKSTQDGTPSPDAPVEIVDFAPGSVAVTGVNLFRGIGVPNDEDGYYINNGLNGSPTTDGYRRFYLDNSGSETVSYNNNAWVSKDIVADKITPNTTYKILIEFRNVKNSKELFGLYVDSYNAASGQHGVFTWSNAQNEKYKVTSAITEGAKYIITGTTSDSHNYSNATCALRTQAQVKANAIMDFEMRISIYPADYDVQDYAPYTGATYPVPLTLRGIPVDEGGNYTDETGQQYIADTYDVVTGEYVQRVGVINSYASEAVEPPYMSTTGDLTAGAHVLYALAEPIVTHLDPQQVLAYSPTTQISAGGGYIGAKLGAAMAPVRTTPQELTQAQMLQALANLGLTVDTETGAVTWGTVTADPEATEQTD